MTVTEEIGIYCTPPHRLRPFSLREKDTPPGMEVVDRVGNWRSRLREVLQLLFPHPNPPPEGEGKLVRIHLSVEASRCALGAHLFTLGEKQCALFVGRISKRQFA